MEKENNNEIPEASGPAAEFWSTLEPNLKQILTKVSQQLQEQVNNMIRQYTAELSQQLKTGFEHISSMPDQVNKSLNGFTSAVLDRVEDPRGRVAFNFQKSILRGLLSLYDLLQDLEKNREKVLNHEEHLANYNAIRTQLVQLLDFNDVKSLTPEPGTELNAQYHRALGVVPTDNPQENNCIESCIRDGFSYGSMVLRPAEVIVKKYSAEPDAAPISNENKS
jgi:molecular chaperone GrpE (heat shock protein)